MSDHGQWLASANRIVVKIGSNSVTGKNEAECFFSDRESAKRFFEKFNRFLNFDFFN